LRDAFVGDLSDYLKYALLRELAAGGVSLGVAWYLNDGPHGANGPGGGKRLEYLAAAHWRRLDAPLHASLERLVGRGDRSIAAVERLRFWPRETTFHREPVPANALRGAWAAAMAHRLRDCGLVFLDPDNGVGAPSRRHATLGEVRGFLRPGRAVLLIKFPARVAFAQQVRGYHVELHGSCGAHSVITLQASCTVGRGVARCWFTLLDGSEDAERRFRSFAARLETIPGARAPIAASVRGARGQAEFLPPIPTAPTVPAGDTAPWRGAGRKPRRR
jgi:hypothetical protein